MRLILPILLSAFFVLYACNNASVKQTEENVVDSNNNEMTNPTELLRHVVLFNFNDDATDEVVKSIEEAFAGLPAKIPEIHDFEWGTNNSPEGLDKGLTHCFFVTFLSEEDRATYLPHPDHQEFVKLVGPYVEDVTVVDYWIK